MSLRHSTVPIPGPGRLTLIGLALVPMILGYPWSNTLQRVVLLGGIVWIIFLLCWRRGLYFTTLIGRRIALITPRSAQNARTQYRSNHDGDTTVVLKVTSEQKSPQTLPVPLIATYLNRYGLQAKMIRITTHTFSHDHETHHETWIGLTYSAVTNLSALQARSSDIPLHQTAEVAVRRLGDHLRELGWESMVADPHEVPEIVNGNIQETWQSVIDGKQGYISAYRVAVTSDLNQTLQTLQQRSAQEVWTIVEIAGTAENPTIGVACVLRTDTLPDVNAFPQVVTCERGQQRTALKKLDLFSTQQLEGHTSLEPGDLEQLHLHLSASGV